MLVGVIGQQTAAKPVCDLRHNRPDNAERAAVGKRGGFGGEAGFKEDKLVGDKATRIIFSGFIAA